MNRTVMDDPECDDVTPVTSTPPLSPNISRWQCKPDCSLLLYFKVEHVNNKYYMAAKIYIFLIKSFRIMA